MTAKMTAVERRARAGHARMMLQRILPNRRSKVWTLTRFGRGERDYVRLFVARPAGEIVEITFYVAVLTDQPLHDDGIGYGGGQYSKALEAADDAWRARFDEPLPQSQWQDLGARAH